MRYIFVAVVALCMFLPVRADSFVTLSLKASGVGGQVCFSGTISDPVSGGEIPEFCTDASGVALINLPAWVPYRITERVPSGYAVGGIACTSSGKYRVSGPSVTVNVEGGPVTCTFSHIRKSGWIPRVTP